MEPWSRGADHPLRVYKLIHAKKERAFIILVDQFRGVMTERSPLQVACGVVPKSIK